MPSSGSARPRRVKLDPKVKFIASPHTSLHWKQRTHTYKICCHIDHNNEIFIILTHDFSKEQYVLPEDDMRYAIETCRSILRVLV